MNRWIKITGFVFAALLLVVVLAWSPVISRLVSEKITSFPKRWGGTASFSRMEVSFLTISIHDLVFYSDDSNQKPVFSAQTLSFSMLFLDALGGSRIPERFRLDSAQIYIAVNPETSRWNIQRTKVATAETDSLAEEGPELAAQSTTESLSFPPLIAPVRWFLSQITDHTLPDIQITNTSAEIDWGVEKLILDEVSVRTHPDSMFFAFSGPAVQFHVEGVNAGAMTRFQLVRPAKVLVPLPDAFALRLAASSGFIGIERKSETLFSVSGSAQALMIDSRALASEPVVFDYGALSSEFSFQDQEVLGSSHFSINQITIKQDFSFRETETFPVFSTTVDIQPVTAQAFRESLPDLLKGPLKNIDFSGELGYELSCAVDFSLVDSLQLDARIIKQDFVLRNTGIDFEALNGAFEQAVYDGLTVKRKVLVGMKNPAFTPIDHIPITLIRAVLTSEDVAFYRHRGFSGESFRTALVDNLKSRKFKRGASTISMQLVKNVFLTREKTIVRKFQELLITWLMEESKIVGKDSMLEIYFNIIEFGPDVYGIGEAAPFYFNKKPQDLTLDECLFLANIIPSPKRFHSRFKDGKLRPSTIRYMEFVADKMVRFQFIPEEERNALMLDNFQLTGRARSIVVPEETIEEEEFQFGGS